MPYKPKKPCKWPGCPRLTDGLYCSEHKALADKNYNQYIRSPEHNKKYGPQWRKIRNRYAKKHPLCECCLKEGRLAEKEKVSQEDFINACQKIIAEEESIKAQFKQN